MSHRAEALPVAEGADDRVKREQPVQQRRPRPRQADQQQRPPDRDLGHLGMGADVADNGLPRPARLVEEAAEADQPGGPRERRSYFSREPRILCFGAFLITLSNGIL